MPQCRVFQDCISVGLRAYISKLTVCCITTKLSLVSKFLLHCLQTRTVSTHVNFVLKPQYIDDWLTVHRSITLIDLQLDVQILIYLHIIHLLKYSTCFEHCPAHLQEVYVVIVYMQPLVSSLSAGDCPVHRLRKNWSDERDY